MVVAQIKKIEQEDRLKSCQQDTMPNSLAYFAIENIRNIIINRVNDNKLIDKMIYAFINVSNREQTIEFYIQHQMMSKTFTDNMRTCLDNAYKAFANAQSGEECLKIEDNCEKDIDNLYEPNKPSTKKANPTITFEQTLKYGGAALITLGFLYAGYKKTPEIIETLKERFNHKN